jgi:hypothetical protein
VDAELDQLPLPSPAPGKTEARIAQEVAARGQLRRLMQALNTDAVADVRAEARGVLEEIYDTLHQNRVALKLIDRCARDMPALSVLWYQKSRDALQLGLSAWLKQRKPQRRFEEEPTLTARFILETMASWAIHRHWDPAPPAVAEELIRKKIVAFLLRAIVPELRGRVSDRRQKSRRSRR